jgi:thiamine-monophosphate kinase
MGGERALTRRLQDWFPAPKDARIAIGDDAAVCKNRGRESVLCVDPVVEGEHFVRGEDLALVGRKAVNRNLSDLAAMGAVADYLLVSLVLPRDLDARDLDRLLRGIRAAANKGGAFVVGGDVSSTSGPLVVTVTAIGHCEGRALLRNGARVGDAIHVTGALGGSIAGKHLRFVPRLKEGAWLARASTPCTACMDVSDGLLLDLWTMLQASGGLGAEIDAHAVPIAMAAQRLARGDRKAALLRALADGEDHELLFTVKKGRTLPTDGPLAARARKPMGRVVNEPGLWLLEDGQRHKVAPAGHEHDVAAD